MVLSLSALDRGAHYLKASTAILVAALAVSMGLVVTGSAKAADYAGPYCSSIASADRCFHNYYGSVGYTWGQISVQYNRDQVCLKARDGHVDGPVSPGSDCSAGGTNWKQAYFWYTTPKKVYGYWAGNGGSIWGLTQAS